MIKLKYCFTILLIATCFTCSSQEVSPEMETIDLSDLELNISKFDELGKPFSIPVGIIDFYQANIDEFNALPGGMYVKLLQKETGNSFIIQYDEVGKAEVQPNGGFLIGEQRIITNVDYIESALYEAIGDGTKDVDITYRNKYTFGVRTGVEICWSYVQEGN